jgi:Skp family chaperone for outer membrane proteins
MNRSRSAVVICAYLFVGLNQNILRAQLPMHVPPPPQHTAVIDLQRILAECKPFQDRLRRHRDKRVERTAGITKMRDQLKSLEQQRKAFYPSSVSYEELTGKMIEHESQIVAAQRKLDFELEREEARLYADFYRTVEKEVQMFALRHNISLVLNRKTPEIAEQHVPHADELFERKVFYEKGIDITDDILGAAALRGSAVDSPVAKPLTTEGQVP